MMSDTLSVQNTLDHQLSQIVETNQSYSPSTEHLKSYQSSKLQKSIDALQQMQLNLELIRAIHKNDVYSEKGVVRLIAKGASIKQLDKTGEHPVRIALSTKSSKTIYFQLVKVLCENFADVSTTDVHGWTPLMTATKSNSIQLVMLLYSYGKRNDLGQINNIKETALHIACHVRSLEIVRFFLSKMSKYGIQRCNVSGLNAFHIACQNGSLEILQVLKNKGCESVKETCAPSSNGKHGTDGKCENRKKIPYKKTLMRRDNRNWTCLHWAIFAGHVQIMRQLFKWGIQDLSKEESDRLNRLGEERASSYIESGTIVMALEKDREIAMKYLEKRRKMIERKKLLFPVKKEDELVMRKGVRRGRGSSSGGVAYQRNGQRK